MALSIEQMQMALLAVGQYKVRLKQEAHVTKAAGCSAESCEREIRDVVILEADLLCEIFNARQGKLPGIL